METTFREPELRGARVPFEALPVIDIAPLLKRDTGRAAVIEALGKAARDIGFFLVTGHGVPRALIDDILGLSREFLAMPNEQKMRWHYTRGSNHTGYVAMGQEVTGDATGVDLKEGLDYHLEIPPDDEDEDFPFYGGPNLWVDEPRGLRELLQRYFAIMLDKNYRVFDALMQSLGYPQDHFADTVSKPIAVLSVRRYPFQAGEITRAELGASPHTDYGYCTLIAQDGTPGLEAQNSAGQWIEVPPLDEAFSCNLGELIERWTNGTLIATRHRAINDTGKDCYSVPFFLSPNRHTRVDVLAQCCSPENPPRFEPVMCGDYFQNRSRYAA